MSGLRAVVRTSLGEQVALQLADLIAQRRWAPGQRLPPESELCQALNIGRSTLREALKSLAFIGMVRTRAGDGTYVAESSRGLLDSILARGLLKTQKDLTDVCEARMALETELAALASERATPNDIQVLEDLIAEGCESLRGNGRSYIEIDLDFHLAVANCAQNKLLSALLVSIRKLLIEWIAKSQELPGLRDNAHLDHQLILKGIKERDPESTRTAMRNHLNAFQRSYSLLSRISDGSAAVAGERAYASS